MTRETPKNIHARAERAALQLLSAKAAGIGEAAVLRHRLDTVIKELDTVNEQYAAALTQLRNSGWTNDELHQLGLTEPLTATARPGRRASTRSAPAPRTPGDVPLIPATAGDAEPQNAITA